MFDKKPIPASFFISSTGVEPVRDFLRGLSKLDKEIVGGDIFSVQVGWPIGMPLCRPMGDGLFEIRSTVTDGRQIRVLFAFHRKSILLLHAFVKKTEKTPERELRVARDRMQRAEQPEQGK